MLKTILQIAPIIEANFVQEQKTEKNPIKLSIKTFNILKFSSELRRENTARLNAVLNKTQNVRIIDFLPYATKYERNHKTRTKKKIIYYTSHNTHPTRHFFYTHKFHYYSFSRNCSSGKKILKGLLIKLIFKCQQKIAHTHTHT